MSIHSIGNSSALSAATYGLGTPVATGESKAGEDLGETGNDGDENGAAQSGGTQNTLTQSASSQMKANSEVYLTPQQKLQDAQQEALTHVADGDEIGSNNSTGKTVNTFA